MSKGFIQLLKCADDLALDVPDAATLLGDFLARAVVDDVLPPALVRVHVRTPPLARAPRKIQTTACVYA
jgi:hypothetical protein